MISASPTACKIRNGTEARKIVPMRAPEGVLPPAAYAKVKDLPQLVWMESGTFLPLKVTNWTRLVVEGTGSDGLLYEIPMARVRGIRDRADLSRRVAKTRAGMEPGDVESRIALAQWCAKRHVRREAKTLGREVLKIQPGEPRAQRILMQLGEE